MQFAVVILVAALYLVDWICSPTVAPLATFFAVSQMALILATPLSPRVIFALALTIDVTATFFLGTMLPSTMYATVTALGFVAFCTSDIGTIVATVSACLVQALETALGSDGLEWSNLSSFAVSYILVALLGSSLRWRKETETKRQEAELAASRMRERERDIRTATDLHDAVTNAMSLIARLAQRQIRLGRDGEDQPWQLVNQEALDALTRTHDIIERLRADTGDIDERTPSDRDFEQELAELLARHDARLHEAGFEGVSVLGMDVPLHLDEKERRLLALLINEAYANIARHAPAHCRYDLSLRFTARGVVLTQINPMPTDESSNTAADAIVSIPDLPSGRNGLAFLSKALNKTSGSLVTSSEDNTWTLYALLPATYAAS